MLFVLRIYPKTRANDDSLFFVFNVNLEYNLTEFERGKYGPTVGPRTTRKGKVANVSSTKPNTEEKV